MQRQYFTFEVKACEKGVVIALNEIPGNTTYHSYEVGLGMENGFSYIYDAELKRNVAEAETKDVLSCTEFRPFWVSWADAGPDRYIRVGTGQVNQEPYLIEYVKLNEKAHLRAVSLDSQDQADWRFPDDAGEKS